MEKKSLQEMVEGRKETASKKKFFKKAQLIGEYLGEERRTYAQDCGESFLDTIHHEVQTNSLYVDSYSNHFFGEGSIGVKVCKKDSEGKVLFGEHRPYKEKPDIYAYIPGKWETEFDSLYKKAKEKRKAEKEEEKEEERLRRLEEEKDLKERFGLD